MINIIRKEKEPSCLAEEKQKEATGKKKDGNYKCKEVQSKLKEDFVNKCYLCEQKGNTDFQIEHFKPHQNKNIDLKFDWNNLFLACSYCNGKKGDRYNTNDENQILDCTNSNHDVENWIKYEKPNYPKSDFKIIALKDEKIINNTVKLLNEIYNGNKRTEEKTENLNDLIANELRKLQKLIKKHFKKQDVIKKIKRILSNRSPFTAFKRQIIKDNSAYKEFEKYFD